MDEQFDSEHQMAQVETFSTGAEEWQCLECERRFVMQWAPYKKVVLESGDDNAIHSGSKNGLNVQSEISTDESELSDDLRDALNNLLSDLDFGD